MPTKQQLETALINAHKAGDSAAATALANAIKSGSYDRQEPQPDAVTPNPEIMALGDGGEAQAEEFSKGSFGLLNQMATGIVSEIASGVGGLGSAMFGGMKEGEETRSTIKEAMTPTPEPETQKMMGKVAEVTENIPEVGKLLGRTAQDLGASPGVATAAEVAPTALVELVGLGWLRNLKQGTRLLDESGEPTKVLRKELDKRGLDYYNLTPEAKRTIPEVAPESKMTRQKLIGDQAEKALVKQVETGGRDEALAGLKVENGKLTPNKGGVDALKQGWASGFVRSLETATPETKQMGREMLKIYRQIKSQERKGLDVRPSDIAGKAVIERLQGVRAAANKARDELGVIAKTELGGLEINTDIIFNQLNKSLDDLEIKPIYQEGSKLPESLDFSDSIISKNKSAQTAILDAIDILGAKGTIDAKRAHKIKKQLDDIIDFNKKSSEGLSEKGRNVLKALRSAVNDSIRGSHTRYAEVNDVLNESLTAINAFDEAVGSSINIFDRGAMSAVGTKLRGLMSNIQSRVKLENSLYNLDKAHTNLVGARKDDIKDLVMIANALDARGGAVAKTSIGGELEKSINRVLNQGMAQEASNVVGRAAEATIRKVKGVNEFNAYEALEELLRTK